MMTPVLVIIFQFYFWYYRLSEINLHIRRCNEKGYRLSITCKYTCILFHNYCKCYCERKGYFFPFCQWATKIDTKKLLSSLTCFSVWLPFSLRTSTVSVRDWNVVVEQLWLPFFLPSLLNAKFPATFNRFNCNQYFFRMAVMTHAARGIFRKHLFYILPYSLTFLHSIIIETFQ